VRGFLGWTKGKLGRHFYVRQLRDMKLAPFVELRRHRSAATSASLRP